MKNLAKTPKKPLNNVNFLGKALWDETIGFAHTLQCFLMALQPLQPKSSHSCSDRKCLWMEDDTGSLKPQVCFPKEDGNF